MTQRWWLPLEQRRTTSVYSSREPPVFSRMLVMLVLAHQPVVGSFSDHFPSLRASQHALRSRSLQTTTCSLHVAQEISADSGLMGDQIAVSEDETLVVTTDATSAEVTMWTNSGYLDAATTGQYAFTDSDSPPVGSSGNFDGVMIHPGLPRIYAFSYGAGSNYVLVSVYDESHPTDPLEVEGTGIVDITGSDGEEDTVIQSAHTVNWVFATHLGCFVDNSGSRTLVDKYTDGSMTTEFCYNRCDAAGFVYFGTQYGQECWCGDENTDVDLNGAATNCDMPCAGDTDEFCGGNDAISISRIHDTAVADGVIIGLIGAGGGARRITVDNNGVFGAASVFPDFEKNGPNDAKAMVFSPDGSTLYITSNGDVAAISSSGASSPGWWVSVSASNLCDIAVSPDGLSVYVLSCSNGNVIHVRLNAVNGAVTSTTHYTTTSSSVGGIASTTVFQIEALEHSIVAARSNSDEIVVFQRAASSGVLSSATTTHLGSGVVNGLVHSDQTGKLFVLKAGGIAVLDVDCGAPTPAPTTTAPTLSPSPAPTTLSPSPAPTTLSPSPAPTTLAPSPAPTTLPPSPAPTLPPSPAPSALPTPAPTFLSTVPELVEARLAAAVHGVDINFEPERGGSGLWCHGVNCLGSTCEVAVLLNSETTASAGAGASCTWKDATTVLVTFGQGYTLAENSVVTLNGDSEYISGCPECGEYASGSAVVQARAVPPQLSSAQFTNTGAQVAVVFSGNPASQEINGTFDAVSCNSVFSDASASTLGAGHTCQFMSSSVIKVTLGALPSIIPSPDSTCTDGDGTSLTLLAGVVRTDIGAFLTSSAQCIGVDPPSNPDPPFVVISAPGAAGNCDNLTLEGSATVASTGTTNVTWEVTLAADEPSVDTSSISRVFEEANLANDPRVTIPSGYMTQGSTYGFVLSVETMLGGSAEAEVEVYKSSRELLISKVLGSSVIQCTRGSQVTILTETSLSSCSTLVAGEGVASYSWSLKAANESRAGLQLAVEPGRDPRVLGLPPYTLGFAGSSYLFQFRSALNAETATTANVTVEVVSGAIIAVISGGSRRTLGAAQVLHLDASASVDEDGVGDDPFEFGWYCENSSGGACLSRGGDVLLNLASSSQEATLSFPAGTLPIGVEYVFTVTVSKGFNGGPVRSQYRSDTARCFVSTSVQDTPLVSIFPKETRRKYNPSSRLVLYGCAAASIEDRCSNRTAAGFDFEWDQINGNLEESRERGDVFRTVASHPTLVLRAGVLSPGRSYTFSMTATDLVGGIGYSEFSFETNAAPIGGYVDSDLRQITAGQDAVTLQTMAWTDDFDDLPMVYEFGYTDGWHEVRSVSSLWITMVSSGASSSSQLHTHLPPGTSLNGFNITVVAYASDNLGARAVTSLGVDGVPLAFLSILPDQLSVSSLLANISLLSAGGESSLLGPADALRNAAAVSSILQYVPEPESAEERMEVIELKEAIVSVVAESYLALDRTPAAAEAAAETFARAVTSYSENGPMNTTVVAVVSGVVTDMIEVSTLNGQVLDPGVALSLLQTVSVLLDESIVLPVPAGGNSSARSEEALDVLGSLGRAVAIGVEAGEEVDEVRTSTVNLRAAKVAQWSIPDAVIDVGENGTQVSFADWDVPSDVEDNSTVVVAVASMNTFASEGLQGATSIDAWNTMGDRVTDLVFPVSFVSRIEGAERTADGVSPACVVWSETSNEWVVDGVVVESIVAELNGTSTITCSTFHLSLFAIADEEAPSTEWATFGQLVGIGVLQQYGAESWPAILFLSLVAVVFLVPAVLLYFKDAHPGQRQQSLENLRSIYLDRGRCSRADQPVKVRIKDRVRAAHEDVTKSNQLDSGYLQVHTVSRTMQKDHIAKTVARSVFMNHAWSHLRSGPVAHFKKTLLTRSQHLVVLLAEWMSAVALQAVFYGKSQSSIREKAKMTAVTALFMIPTALVFPALLRKANTPPSSVTLTRSTWHERQAGDDQPFLARDGHTMRQQDRQSDEKDRPSDEEDRSSAGTSTRGIQRSLSGAASAMEAKHAQSAQARRNRERRLRVIAQPVDQDVGCANSMVVSANKTRVYSETVISQQVMVGFYLFLPIWMALLVPMVFRGTTKAEESPGGDEDVLILNMTASLAIICALLCVIAGYGVGTNKVDVMTQIMAFQAIVGPGLVLCGVMLYGLDATLATGAVIGGLGMLLCAYFLRLHRMNELALQGACQEDLITTWSNPSPTMQSAACLVQGKFRMHLATTRAIRALEFSTWLDKCSSQRSVMYILVNATVYLTVLCLSYTNLVFAARFDRETCTNWLTTCVIALVVEATLQQPVVLLTTGVLGDFVEEGADFLLELLDF